MSRAALLAAAMDENYQRLRTRLSGLTDAEFFWEPVAGCWNIYEDRSGHWTYHYAIPDPDPAPLTSIGWQVVHIATCKVMYHEWAFGPARRTFPELVIPHTVAAGIEMLDDGQRRLVDVLGELPEPQLDEPRKTNWGELWPAWHIFWAMADHDALHAGAIGNLRDLYVWSRDRT
jgi:hypothetical protein